MGGLLLGTQSYAASLSAGGRATLVHAGGSHCRHCAGRAPVGGVPLRAVSRVLRRPLDGLAKYAAAHAQARAARKKAAKERRNEKKTCKKNRKRTCQVSGACCIIQTYQSKSTGAKSLLYVRGAYTMTNPGRKRRKRKTVLGVFFRLFFLYCCCSVCWQRTSPIRWPSAPNAQSCRP